MVSDRGRRRIASGINDGLDRASSALERLERRVMLDTVPAGDEFRVNTVTTNNQRFPAVAMNDDGDFVVAWQTSFPSPGIDARRYTADGVPYGDEFRVNTGTSGGARPAVAMHSDGGFVVTWDAFGDGHNSGIFARRFGADGNALGDQFLVNTYTTEQQDSPSIAMDDDGHFVVAWNGYHQDGSGFGIFAQRYGADGQTRGDEFRVNVTTSGHQRNCAASIDADGDFVITWSGTGAGDDGGVFARRYGADGVALSGEFQVNVLTSGNQREPTVAMDAGGAFVVAWSSASDKGSDGDLFMRRFSNTGAALGGELPLNTYTANNQGGVTMAMTAGGDFVVTWSSEGQDGSLHGTYARRYAASGAPEGDEFRVHTYTTANQWVSSIGMNADGDFTIAWESVGQDGDSGGIYAQRYAVVPVVTASSFLFETAPHRLRFTFDENLSNSLGTDDLVVHNLTTGQTLTSTDFTLAYNLATRTATFTYTGNAGGFPGVLGDGNFRATLLATGTSLPADHAFDFRFLRADATGDGRVNLQDFNRLAANFGQSPRTFSQGDFNYDTVVNLSDFNLLAGRFGQVLSIASPGEDSTTGTTHRDDDDDDDRQLDGLS